MRALKQGPCYTTELAARAGASVYWTREVLKQLETRGLVRSWTFAQADRGGRNLTVHAWRLTTEEERRCGKEDRSATAHASALLSRVLRGRLRVVERANERLVQAARREREISPS
jgi:predicted ArsR family transcriptional regulator